MVLSFTAISININGGDPSLQVTENRAEAILTYSYSLAVGIAPNASLLISVVTVPRTAIGE